MVEGRLPNSSHFRSADKNIKDLEKAQEEPLVRFLYLILDKLFMLLVRPPTAAGTVGKSW